MEEIVVASIIELTPIETIGNNDSTASTNYEFTFSTPKESRLLGQMGDAENHSIKVKYKTKIKPNQVGIAVPLNEENRRDLSKNDPENLLSIWDSEKAWHEQNALARESIFKSILQDDRSKFSWASTFFSGLTYTGFYQVLIMILRIFRGKFQPLIALVFPASREIWGWVLGKLVKCCANGDERGAMIVYQYIFNTNHTIC